MSKQCLDVHQMQHLQELGLDTSNASALYCIDNESGDKQLMWNEQVEETDKDDEYFRIVPAYTLQDVMDALPRFVIDDGGNKYYLQIEMMNAEFDDWRVSYKSVGQDESPLGYFQASHLIDAAVRMLVLCYEQGYVETNKNE